MRKLMTCLGLVLAAAALITACGSDEGGAQRDDSDEAEVRDVIALGNDKDPALCDRLTDKWMKNVVGGDRSDCEEQIQNSDRDAVQVEQVEVQGDRATVTAQVQGDPGRLYLAKQGGEWKLDDIRQGGE